MLEPLVVLNNLEAARAQTLHRFSSLTQEQLDWRPPASEEREEETAWSLGEVFMHLAIDEHYLREEIARPLLEGVKPPDGVMFLPPPPPYGMQKQVIQFWFERARVMTCRLLEAWPADANLDLVHIGGLEAMNALEWLDGYGSHEAFHHKQIDSLIGQFDESYRVKHGK